MATIEENRVTWNDRWDWSARGDEWSQRWGGTSAMWRDAVLPRIQEFVPSPTILEIGPGFGRWTAYLRELAGQLVVVDLAPRCIAACRERFAACTNIAYFVNDGRSLPMIADASVDFVFSFDSLVHADAEAIHGYIGELARVLTADGVAFIHHSDLGGFPPGGIRLAEIIAARHRSLRQTSPLLEWRARDVSAALVRRLASEAGLQCRRQELVTWTGPYLTDCFSVISRRGSKWRGPNVVVKNRRFRHAATCSGIPMGTRAGSGS